EMLKGGDTSDGAIQAARAAAWNPIKSPDFLIKLAARFNGVSGSYEAISTSQPLDKYKQAVMEKVGANVQSGAGVMVLKKGHWTRLQALHEEHIIIDDPGGSNKVNHKLSWAEAKEGEYFQIRVILRG